MLVNEDEIVKMLDEEERLREEGPVLALGSKSHGWKRFSDHDRFGDDDGEEGVQEIDEPQRGRTRIRV